MKIGSYHLPNKLVLAPMAGVTDRPFRQLCRNMGAGMAVSEMVSSNSLLWGSEKTRRRADHQGETEPRSVQIMGADPQLMAQAAQRNVEFGAQIIDINMGCPAKKVCNVSAGSALMRDEKLVGEILHAVVNAVPEIPVTLKIRTGWDSENRNGLTIGRIAEAEGIQALAVHGRTRSDAYRGSAEYDTIATIKQSLSIPVIANGDITTPEKAKFVLEYTKADAVMIGRAAQGRPWIFREINHYLVTGEHLADPTHQEIHDILCGHLENLYQFYGEFTGVRMARKHISWYSKGQRDGGAFRNAVNRVDTREQQLDMVNHFFKALIEGEDQAA
jgi:tRNA-dihydrouridine synthase B